MEKEVYSLCFMCSVRCPIRVLVKNGQVSWIEGNPHVGGMEKALCPRGAAGTALLNDTQRLQTPLIRVGERGSGQWRRASWDEALDLVADKLSKIKETWGPQSITWGERANLATHVSKTFMAALGSPNYFSHDALCKGSVNTACRSLFGLTDAQVGLDYKNARQIILYGRNMFEAISVKEVNSLMAALEAGAKLTYIDPRATVTAAKSHRYWMIRPGTDLALNYALMNVIINEELYDASFVGQWIHGFEELEAFVRPYTPEWAETETGIQKEKIITLAREVAKDSPKVIFHYGYRGAGEANEIYLRRSLLMLNALMGSIETKGGLFFKKGPGELGKKPARKLSAGDVSKPEAIRCDKVGTKDFPLPDPAHGVPQTLPETILNQDPYPVKAMIAFRFDPLMSMPDRNLTIKAINKLDLVVSIDINFSDTAWYSDVILPESIYLERMDCVQQANGLNPQMYIRRQAVAPRYDTREGAMIIKALADRLGIGRHFPYESMEDLVRWQLEGTGFSLEDFDKKGFVAYGKGPIFRDRSKDFGLKTPSGKIEFKSSLLEDAGFESFPPYIPVKARDANQFQLVVGRCAIHTHISTQNNPLLNEQVPENMLWINAGRASALGVKDKEMVKVVSPAGTVSMKAHVTDLIHPEAAFMLHGFGHLAEKGKRCYKKGGSDAELQQNITDTVGGSPALHATVVQVFAEAS